MYDGFDSDCICRELDSFKNGDVGIRQDKISSIEIFAYDSDIQSIPHVILDASSHLHPFFELFSRRHRRQMQSFEDDLTQSVMLKIYGQIVYALYVWSRYDSLSFNIASSRYFFFSPLIERPRCSSDDDIRSHSI